MKQPAFLEGVAFALATSITGSMLMAALPVFLPGSLVLRLVIAGIGLGYILYLILRSRRRIGRITVLAAWMLMAVFSWISGPPLVLYVLIHVLSVWLIRSLYYHTSVLPALADLALNGLGLAAALWAIARTDSMFLAIWSFFLVQALFISIPKSLYRDSSGNPLGPQHPDRFEHAHGIAEAALRKLTPTR